MRALTRLRVHAATHLMPCNNEVLAREGIDTSEKILLRLPDYHSNNEVLAREGIDTSP